MTTDSPAIRVESLSKSFQLYNRPFDILLEMLTRKTRHKEFWALRDVSFSIARGQVVGIIGQNGAGKSTLLKIITGTLNKTSGSVEVNGRISSILELGTGFDELTTGRENVVMGGMIVGMSRQEIEQKLEWIIDFSELRRVIDQPFRTYSTGMKARLTFATALCIDPDILIVDEVLSVGDARFQKKSFNHIKQFRDAGNTILLVSHDLNTVSQFCDHVIYLDKGQVVDEGDPPRITKLYYRHTVLRQEAELNQNNSSSTQQSDEQSDEESRLMRMGSSEAEIIAYGVRDAEGHELRDLQPGESYEFYMVLHFHKDMAQPIFGFLIRDIKGVDLFGVSSATMKMLVDKPCKAGEQLTVILEVEMNITNGAYFMTFAAGGYNIDGSDFQYDMLYDGLEFRVRQMLDTFETTKVNLKPHMQIIHQETPVTEKASV